MKICSLLLARGFSELARGILPLARGFSELARGILPLARGFPELARGILPLARGILPLARGILPLAREQLRCCNVTRGTRSSKHFLLCPDNEQYRLASECP